MTGNSVEKCFAVWNEIQNVIYTAFALDTTTHTACFARNFCISYQQMCILRTGNDSLKTYNELKFLFKKSHMSCHIFCRQGQVKSDENISITEALYSARNAYLGTKLFGFL